MPLPAIILVIPIGLPGAGKSTLLKRLFDCLKSKQKFVQESRSLLNRADSDFDSVSLISSDETGLVGPSAAAKIRELCDKALKRIVSSLKPNARSNHVILLDKNHSNHTVHRSVELFSTDKLRVKTLVVSISEPDSARSSLNHISVDSPVASEWPYPFSSGYVLTCLHRCLKRTGHPSLCGNDLIITKAVLSHLNAHRKAHAPERFFSRTKVSVIVAPLVVPSTQLESSDHLIMNNDIDGLLDLIFNTPICSIPEKSLEKATKDVSDKIHSFTRIRSYPRYHGVVLSKHREFFLSFLFESGFRISCKSSLVAQPHCTLIYLGKEEPSTVSRAEVEESIFELTDRSLSLQLKAVVYVPFGLACLSVDIKGIDASLHPLYPHVTLFNGGQFQARHSAELLQLAEKLLSDKSLQRHHESTPNGTLTKFTDLNIHHEIMPNVNELCIWKPRGKHSFYGTIKQFWF